MAIPDLFETSLIPAAGDSLDLQTYVPNRLAPISFKTRFEVTGVANGSLISAGDSGRGFELYFDSGTLHMIAGSGVDANFAAQGSAVIAPGRVTELTASIRPGDGQIRVWDNRKLIITAQAPNKTFSTEWANSGNIDFYKLPTAVNALAGLGADLAPTGLFAHEGLTLYRLQIPRHFGDVDIADIIAAVDDLLFYGTAINFMIGNVPFLDP